MPSHYEASVRSSAHLTSFYLVMVYKDMRKYVSDIFLSWLYLCVILFLCFKRAGRQWPHMLGDRGALCWAFTYVYACMHTYVLMLAYINTYINTDARWRSQVCSRAHQMCSYLHTYKHTYIHTYIQMREDDLKSAQELIRCALFDRSDNVCPCMFVWFLFVQCAVVFVFVKVAWVGLTENTYTS
jgi:hypothetical protein